MKKVELVLDFGCDCRCAFCVVDAEAAGRRMSAAEAEAHLERARAGGATQADFGGGEPTLREELPELARRARTLGFSRVGVKTHGRRLADPSYVETLLRAGVDAFFVPIWGDTPQVHDALCRMPGTFDRLEMGVKNALDLGAEVEADVLLTRATVPRLSRLVERFADHGVRRFNAWLFSLFGSGGTVPALLPRLREAGAAAVAAAWALEARGARLRTTQLPPCVLAPRADLYWNISEAGLVIVTPGGQFPAEQSPFEAGRQTDKCAACALRARCAGARPEYLERFTDAELSPVAGGPA